MNKKAFFLMIVLVVFILAFGFEYAAPQEPFYKGKVIRMIVGLSAGGGFGIEDICLGVGVLLQWVRRLDQELH